MSVKKPIKKPVKKLEPSTLKGSQGGLFNKAWLPPVLFIFLTLIVYSGVTGFELVFLDDDMMFDNLKMLHLKPYSIFYESISRDAMAGVGGDLYRPLQTFFLIFLYKFGHGSLLYFHYAQILLHMTACYAVYRLLLLFNRDVKTALILTLIFGLHPLFASLISFIPAIGDQMLLVFGVTSCIFFILFLQKRKNFYLILHLLSFSLTVLTKETALVLPGVFILYALLIHPQRLPVTKWLIPVLFWCLITGFYFLLRQKFVLPGQIAPQNVLNAENISANTLYNFPSLFEYLTKFFLPFNLSFLALYSTTRTIIGIVITMSFILLTLTKKLDYRLLLFGFFWYGAFIVPSMLYHNPLFDYGEHRGFLPLLAVVILVASLKVNPKYVLYGAVLIPLFVIMSFVRKNDFKDPLAFYTAIIDNDPVPMAYLNRGSYIHRHKKDIKAVLADYDKAIEMKSDYATALYNRAILKSEDLKDYAGAFADLNKAIKAKPDYADAYYHKGYLMITAQNDVQGALMNIDSAIILNPAFVLAYNNRGIIRQTYKNDTLGAFSDFNKSIEVQPLANPTPYLYRGLYYLNKGQKNEACSDWKIAAEQGNAQAASFIQSNCN